VYNYKEQKNRQIQLVYNILSEIGFRPDKIYKFVRSNFHISKSHYYTVLSMELDHVEITEPSHAYLHVKKLEMQFQNNSLIGSPNSSRTQLAAQG
jgi:hypothetical protein